jgi:uncharacterized protein YndB with AHSA1/START domain
MPQAAPLLDEADDRTRGAHLGYTPTSGTYVTRGVRAGSSVMGVLLVAASACLARWWIPRPALCRVAALDLRPGGAFVTEISGNGGAFEPHLSACFLDVVPEQRIVFTDALTGGWRPATKGFMTAVITVREHPDGTAYSARAMHKDRSDRDKHEELGFHEGWSTVTAQLAELVEVTR